MDSASTHAGRAASGESPSAARLVVLLALVASVGYLCRVVMTVAAPSLMKEFNFSSIEMGKIFSAFLIGYTVFQVPSGWLADRLGAGPLFLAVTLGWALLTAAVPAVGWLRMVTPERALVTFLALRVLIGVLSAPTYPAAGRTIAVSIPARLQGRANGAVLASIGIGSAVTPPLMGIISTRWGWRPALLAAAGLAALAGVAWWRLAPTDILTRSGAPLVGAVREPLLLTAPVTWRSSLRQRSFWFLAASYTLQGYVGYVFVFWFYLYLVQVRHFDLLKAAWLTALPWVSSLVAIPLGGVISDWAVGRLGPVRGRCSVPVPALVLSAGMLVVGARAENAGLAVASLTLSTALVLSTEGPFWATMNQLAGPRSGIGGGVMNFGSNLGGMVSPVVTPWLAMKLGWETALSLTALVAVFAALLWMRVEIPQASTQ